jgi:hypothetical protein|tara:strand:- start:52 stop:171 length:120 start_codon:yes stop_codon:yes gene_type:complete
MEFIDLLALVTTIIYSFSAGYLVSEMQQLRKYIQNECLK